ncbi:MAG: GNAT family protein [Bacteroidales bacterium]
MLQLQNIKIEKVVIESENLVLKEIPFQYKTSFFGLFSDLEMLKFTDKKPTLSIDEALLYLKECIDKNKEKKHIYFGIFTKPDHGLLGIVSLYHIDFKHKFGSLGILLDKKKWRQGIMTEALTAFLKFCFDEVNFHRIEAQTFVNNIAAVKFFEKMKFKNEGRLRENFLISGKFEDSYLFSLLKHEFGP